MEIAVILSQAEGNEGVIIRKILCRKELGAITLGQGWGNTGRTIVVAMVADRVGHEASKNTAVSSSHSGCSQQQVVTGCRSIGSKARQCLGVRVNKSAKAVNLRKYPRGGNFRNHILGGGSPEGGRRLGVGSATTDGADDLKKSRMPLGVDWC